MDSSMKSLLTPLLIIFSLLISLPTQAGSSVWKVSNGNHHLFIGGTIHVLSQRDYPLPKEFEQAYSQANLIVFETSIQEMKTPSAQQQLLSKTTYPAGHSIKENIRSETFNALEHYFSSRQLPLNNFLLFKPGMLSITMTMIELQVLGLGGTGVDEFYTLKAINDQKILGELESLEQQIDFIANLGNEDPDRLINYTLRDIGNLTAILTDMKRAWRDGDSSELNKLAVKPMQDEFPEIYDVLLLNRNNAWVPQIEAMIATSDIEFILVGVAHLAGKHSVLEQLRLRGYSVEML
jgi:uncharacterized protein YbaP (TraB family)